MSTERKDEVGRRSFLRSAGTLAAAPKPFIVPIPGTR